MIRDLRFEGSGCAISTASASLMSEAVKGRTRAEAAEIFGAVHRMLTGEPADGGRLGKLAALAGVRAVPGAGQVREPLLAHAERGARGRARPGHDGVSMRRAAQEPVVVNRDVRAVIVPAGVEVKLRPGTVGTITQALGGSYTIYVEGNLFRIAGVDGDAIGKEPIQPPALPAGASDEDVNRVVWDQLRTCFDPRSRSTSSTSASSTTAASRPTRTARATSPSR